jgi:hypothetical protein
MRKALTSVAVLLVAFTLLAEASEWLNRPIPKLILEDGTVYSDVTIIGISEKFIAIKHTSGERTIPMVLLRPESQAALGYNPTTDSGRTTPPPVAVPPAPIVGTSFPSSKAAEMETKKMPSQQEDNHREKAVDRDRSIWSLPSDRSRAGSRFTYSTPDAQRFAAESLAPAQAAIRQAEEEERKRRAEDLAFEWNSFFLEQAKEEARRKEASRNIVPDSGNDLRGAPSSTTEDLVFPGLLKLNKPAEPDNGGRFAEVNSPFPPRNRIHSDDRDDDGLMDFYTRQGRAIQTDGEGSYSVMDLNTGRMTAVQSDGEGNYSAMDLNTGKMSAIKVNSDGSAAVMDLETGRISFLP